LQPVPVDLIGCLPQIYSILRKSGLAGGGMHGIRGA